MAPRYAVLGAGNGGCAMAAELSLLGREVVLLDHAAFEARLAPLRDAGGIEVDSRAERFAGGKGLHFAPLPHVGTDFAAVAAADIVIPVVPGQHHGAMIAAVLPHLRRGQLVLLNPGGVGGTLVWAAALRQAGLTGIQLAQAGDLSYAGFRTPDARVVVGGKKASVALGVFPHRDAAAVMDRLRPDFPEFALAANALDAGLQGPGMLVHPLPMLMNAVRIDREAPLVYDAYDITPSVARAVEALDAERMALVTALGGHAKPIQDILTAYYGVRGPDFYSTVQAVPAYRRSTAPRDFTHRYITEEVPAQIVPATELARLFGIATPVMGATVALAGAVAGEDFARTGWTLDRMGLAGLDRAGMMDLLAG